MNMNIDRAMLDPSSADRDPLQSLSSMTSRTSPTFIPRRPRSLVLVHGEHGNNDMNDSDDHRPDPHTHLHHPRRLDDRHHHHNNNDHRNTLPNSNSNNFHDSHPHQLHHFKHHRTLDRMNGGHRSYRGPHFDDYHIDYHLDGFHKHRLDYNNNHRHHNNTTNNNNNHPRQNENTINDNQNDDQENQIAQDAPQGSQGTRQGVYDHHDDFEVDEDQTIVTNNGHGRNQVRPALFNQPQVHEVGPMAVPLSGATRPISCVPKASPTASSHHQPHHQHHHQPTRQQGWPDNLTSGGTTNATSTKPSVTHVQHPPFSHHHTRPNITIDTSAPVLRLSTPPPVRPYSSSVSSTRPISATAATAAAATPSLGTLALLSSSASANFLAPSSSQKLVSSSMCASASQDSNKSDCASLTLAGNREKGEEEERQQGKVEEEEEEEDDDDDAAVHQLSSSTKTTKTSSSTFSSSSSPSKSMNGVQVSLSAGTTLASTTEGDQCLPPRAQPNQKQSPTTSALASQFSHLQKHPSARGPDQQQQDQCHRQDQQPHHHLCAQSPLLSGSRASGAVKDRQQQQQPSPPMTASSTTLSNSNPPTLPPPHFSYSNPSLPPQIPPQSQPQAQPQTQTLSQYQSSYRQPMLHEQLRQMRNMPPTPESTGHPTLASSTSSNGSSGGLAASLTVGSAPLLPALSPTSPKAGSSSGSSSLASSLEQLSLSWKAPENTPSFPINRLHRSRTLSSGTGPYRPGMHPSTTTTGTGSAYFSNLYSNQNQSSPISAVTSSSYSSMPYSPAVAFLSNFVEATAPRMAPDEEGEQVGEFIMGRVIGHGGFSVVREAFAVQMDGLVAKVAVKIVKTHTGATDNSRIQRLLRREINIWSRLHHRNVVPFVAVERLELGTFVFCELCTGGHLLDYISKNRTPGSGLKESEARRIFAQIAEAVRYLHEELRIVHRDIKLENILRHEDGVWKICDFGLAEFQNEEAALYFGSSPMLSPELPSPSVPGFAGKTSGGGMVAFGAENRGFNNHASGQHRSGGAHERSFSMSDLDNSERTVPQHNHHHNNTSIGQEDEADEEDEDSHVGGSLAYCSPEQLRSHRPLKCPSSDVWSLGVVLYALLTGRLPFQDEYEPRLQHRILNGTFEDPTECSDEARALIKNMFQAKPENRWRIDQVMDSDWYQDRKMEVDSDNGGGETDAFSSYNAFMSGFGAFSSR